MKIEYLIDYRNQPVYSACSPVAVSVIISDLVERFGEDARKFINVTRVTSEPYALSPAGSSVLDGTRDDG